MIRKLRAAIVLCVVVVCHSLGAQTTTSARRPRIPVRTGINDSTLDVKVDALLHKMTLEEKVGQLVQYSAGQPTGPGTGRTDYNDMIAKGQVGALFNISTARETNAYQRMAVEKSRLHIPLFLAWMSSTASVPNSRFRSVWHQPGIQSWCSKQPVSQPAKLQQPEFDGRFLLWSTSRAMPVGVVWRKARGRIRFLALRWQPPTFADIRAHVWTLPIASPPVPSIT